MLSSKSALSFCAFCLLVSGSSVHGLVTIAGNQSGDPLGDPSFPTNNVGHRFSPGNNTGAVYLTNGWVLSASHAGTGPVSFDGGSTFYSAVSGTSTQFGTDLTLYQINGDPGLPDLHIYCGTIAVGDEVVVTGGGLGSSGTSSPYPHSGFNPGGWGTNTISAITTSTAGDDIFETTFDNPADPPGPATSLATPFESQLTAGDSGGGWFIDNGGTWELVAISNGALTQSATSSTYGDISQALDLAPYKDQINAIIAVPEPSTATLSALVIAGCLLRRRRSS